LTVGQGQEGKRERDKRHDARRRALKPWRALYKTARWQALRLAQLKQQPLCQRCAADRKVSAATVVHHKDKHDGNEIKFFDPSNLASSCKPCHDAVEQQIEVRGYSTAIGVDGWPVDDRHPGNQTARPPGGSR
jgi:5-methylcytosine-specific restriction endonuclease McrA